MHKKVNVLASLVIVVSGLALSGCELGAPQPGLEGTAVVEERPGVSLKGTLVEAGGKVLLQNGKSSTEVDSRRIDLRSKVGMEVEVHGEYSGTTLYVDEVK